MSVRFGCRNPSAAGFKASWLCIVACVRLGAALLLTFGAGATLAFEDACTFARSIQGQDGRMLSLAGAGTRRFWWKPVNAVALYAPQPTDSWAAVSAGTGEARAEVVFLVERFGRAQLRDSWMERFDVLIEPDQRTSQAAAVKAFLDMLPEIVRGDTLSFSSTAQGLTLALNRKTLGRAGDLAFGRLVLSSWFGNQPASADLKTAVFSGATVGSLPCVR